MAISGIRPYIFGATKQVNRAPVKPHRFASAPTVDHKLLKRLPALYDKTADFDPFIVAEALNLDVNETSASNQAGLAADLLLATHENKAAISLKDAEAVFAKGFPKPTGTPSNPAPNPEDHANAMNQLFTAAVAGLKDAGHITEQNGHLLITTKLLDTLDTHEPEG